MMRRVFALAAAIVLGATVSGSGLAAAGSAKLSFSGDFVQLAGDGTVMGRIVAELGLPSEQNLVPGTYDFQGAPGNWVRESHAVIGHTAYWYDPGHEGGSDVAYGEGVECAFFGVGDATCHEWAVMFIDVRDAAVPNQVAFSIVRDANGAFDFNTETGQAWWYTVGRGDFVMHGTFPIG
jgi:hypothetical protein